jgi:ribosomal protein S18 acetylase RimI-like enzyme
MAEPLTTPIRIRRATLDDIEFVLGLAPQLVAFEAPPWRDVAQMTETDALVLRRALEAASDGAAVFVALGPDDDRLGFIHVCVETDYYTRGPCGHIADLVVRGESRGQGVGEALMGAWSRERNHSLLTLNVFVQNARARALYERQGFASETIRYVKAIGGRR